MPKAYLAGMQTVFYCFDAYCGWCYGFSPVILKFAAAHKDQLQIEVLSGGMILPESPRHISVTAPYIREAYPAVEERTGIEFGESYLWHIENPDESDWYPHSEKPAIALCVFKDFLPDRQVELATDIEYALHYEGRDLCDDEAYRHLLHKYNIVPDQFYERLHSETYKQKAYYEFALCKQLQVSGYPTMLLQAEELKFYLLARGYTDYETLESTFDSVEKALAEKNSQA